MVPGSATQRRLPLLHDVPVVISPTGHCRASIEERLDCRSVLWKRYNQSGGRLSGVATFGMDSSPIAVAIAQAKLCDTTPKQVQQAARHLLAANTEPSDIPRGNFWRRMYHVDVLCAVCTLREALLRDCRSDARTVLRAIIAGATTWAANEDGGIAPFKPVSANVRTQAGLCVTILEGSQSSSAKGGCSGSCTCSVRAIPCGRP